VAVKGISASKQADSQGNLGTNKVIWWKKYQVNHLEIFFSFFQSIISYAKRTEQLLPQQTKSYL
jgi:hypothetical protein